MKLRKPNNGLWAPEVQIYSTEPQKRKKTWTLGPTTASVKCEALQAWDESGSGRLTVAGVASICRLSLWQQSSDATKHTNLSSQKGQGHRRFRYDQKNLVKLDQCRFKGSVGNNLSGVNTACCRSQRKASQCLETRTNSRSTQMKHAGGMHIQYFK